MSDLHDENDVRQLHAIDHAIISDTKTTSALQAVSERLSIG
jgi:hypothetical protein